MNETVMSISALPEFLLRIIPTEKVRVKEIDGIVQLTPIPMKENNDCTIGLRGILSSYDDMSVDGFLERMRTDKELDL
jgi:hypothetical protein